MGLAKMRQNKKSVSPMSNEGRNAYVIEHLTAALVELLQNKTINNISISELCDLAGVGRASFYRNYGCMEEILRAESERRFKKWANEYEASDRSLHQMVKTLFCHLEANKDFYNLLYQNNLFNILKDVIIRNCGPKPEQPKEVAYSTAFIAYTLYGWIETWFTRGMQESAEEIAALTVTLERN